MYCIQFVYVCGHEGLVGPVKESVYRKLSLSYRVVSEITCYNPIAYKFVLKLGVTGLSCSFCNKQRWKGVLYEERPGSYAYKGVSCFLA